MWMLCSFEPDQVDLQVSPSISPLKINLSYTSIHLNTYDLSLILEY
jgi:hypothetical protein